MLTNGKARFTTGEIIILTEKVNADGRFVLPAAWEAPQLKGENTLTFVGQESGDVITTTFSVVP